MPRGLYDLEALEAVSVAGNRITHLSSSVGKLVHLRLLDVSDNALRSLPKVIIIIIIVIIFYTPGSKDPRGQKQEARTNITGGLRSGTEGIHNESRV